MREKRFRFNDILHFELSEGYVNEMKKGHKKYLFIAIVVIILSIVIGIVMYFRSYTDVSLQKQWSRNNMLIESSKGNCIYTNTMNSTDNITFVINSNNGKILNKINKLKVVKVSRNTKVTDPILTSIDTGDAYSDNNFGKICSNLQSCVWNTCIDSDISSYKLFGDTLYVATIPGEIYAIDYNTGKLKWRYGKTYSEKRYWARIAISPSNLAKINNKIYYVDSMNEYLYGFDIKTGNIVVQSKIPDIGISHIETCNGELFIFGENGRAVVLNPRTMTILWSKKFVKHNAYDSLDMNSLVKSDGKFYVLGSKNNSIYSIDSKKRLFIKEYTFNKNVENIQCYKGNLFYTIPDEHDRNLWYMNLKNKKVKALIKLRNKEHIRSIVSDSRGNLYIDYGNDGYSSCKLVKYKIIN